MKTSILTIVIVFLGYLGYTQENWTIVEENEQFSISAKEIEYKNASDGIHHRRIVFRYENHTAHSIVLHFNREVTYDGHSKLQEQDFVVSLSASGIMEYDESKKYDKTYYLFKKDNNNTIKKSLDHFKIIHLRIN